MNLYDAHNHLQDDRLASHHQEIMRAARRQSISKMVVNGSCEEDWNAVLQLARKFPEVIPSFGYHPWYVKKHTPQWETILKQYLDATPSAIGEIGLDRWIKDADAEAQEEAFVPQLRLAAERNLPVSIHCLQAWGRLLEILQCEPLPPCGFLLHSYGGSIEMIAPLANLGAYFSLPGYFANERKLRRREAFRHVPPERLLIETDAPDQPLPEKQIQFPLFDAHGQPVNHPANLKAVYQFAAEWLGQPLEKLAAQVESNFRRLFAPLFRE